MRKTFLLTLAISTMLLISCGKNQALDCLDGCTGHGGGGLPALPTLATLTSSPSNDARLSGVTVTLDLTKLNTEVSVQDLIGSAYCNETQGNTGASVSNNHALVSSVDGGRTGVITFGHLAYYNPSGNDVVCRLFSNEQYNFTYDGTTLVLSAIAVGKPWDGAKSIFVK